MLLSRHGAVRVAGAGVLASAPSSAASAALVLVLDGAVRARARSALHGVLPDAFASLDMRPQDIIMYATQLEACAVMEADNDYARYMEIMSRVVYNMSVNGAYIARKYPVSTICRQNNKRLQAQTAHAQRADGLAQRVVSLMERAKVAADTAAASAAAVSAASAIRCPRCKTQDRINRTAVQRNAGDEGMKTKCRCTHCGHAWELSA